jgi:hypothetical protein
MLTNNVDLVIKPVLNEQRIKEFARTISVSIFTEKNIRILLYGENLNREIIGRIEKIAAESRQIRISSENIYEWIRLEDVLEMELIL